MPDLHDELAAAAERREPPHPPAFSQLLDARRRRDRRGRALGGAAVAALALSGAVVIPTLLDRESSDVLGPANGGSTVVSDYIDRCGRAASSADAEDYIGLSEDEASALAARRWVPFRVIGRDGECPGIQLDLQPGRVNALVQDGVVVWAAVEQPLEVNARYSVSFTSPERFGDDDEAALKECLKLHDARATDVMERFPPIYNVEVTGTEEQVAGFEECLQKLPDTDVERRDTAADD